MSDRLDRRVTLQSRAAGVDAAGQPNGAWSNYRTCYARVMETLGREGLRGEQVEHSGTVRIKIRHPRQGTFPSVEHRATWIEGDTGTSRTVYVDHIERIGSKREYMILHCKEVG